MFKRYTETARCRSDGRAAARVKQDTGQQGKCGQPDESSKDVEGAEEDED